MKLYDKIQVGDIFGDLTVLKINVDTKTESYVADCSCLCGGKTNVSIYHLFNGDTLTCGCGLYGIRKRGGQGYTTWNGVYQIYERNAKKKSRSFSLTLKDFRELASLNCHYCGAEPKLVNRYLDRQGNQKRKNKEYQQSTIDMAYAKINGLDRIDSSLGYEKNNTIPCCFTCNRAKGDMSYKDFIDWISRIKSHDIVHLTSYKDML